MPPSKKTMKKTSTPEMKKKIGSMIYGNPNIHRENINNLITKLSKTVGEEDVGPPVFENKDTWINTFNNLKDIMHKMGEEKNDDPLRKGGILDTYLNKLLVDHKRLLEEAEQRNNEIIELLSVLNTPPSKIPSRILGGKRKRKCGGKKNKRKCGGKKTKRKCGGKKIKK